MKEKCIEKSMKAEMFHGEYGKCQGYENQMTMIDRSYEKISSTVK